MEVFNELSIYEHAYYAGRLGALTSVDKNLKEATFNKEVE